MKIVYNKERDRVEAVSTFEERQVPKHAGFWWDGKNKVWYTRELTNAAKLVDYADKELQKKLFAHKKAYDATLAASRATDADVNLPVPKGLSYLPYQKAGILFASERPSTLIGDEMGLGKAQPLYANILTPSGFQSMGNIRKGMKVIGSNGRPTTVTGVFPQGIRPTYKITFSDRSSTYCDEEHLWQVNTPCRKWRGAPPLVLTLSEIRNRGLTLSNGNRQFFIPLVEPVEFSDILERPIDPYIVGLLIGDGGLSTNTPRFSTPDKELVDAIVNSVDGLSAKRVSEYDFSLIGDNSKSAPNPLTVGLRELGLMGHRAEGKFIPDAYKFAPSSIRLAILQGLMDTDGSVRKKDNHLEYGSVSKRLAEDVVFIVQSLGGTARIRIKKTGFQDFYVVSVTLPNETCPFRLKRKREVWRPRSKYLPSRCIISIEYVGEHPCQCISVETSDQLYVTDDFIVTHNTIQAIGIINADPTVKRVLVICPASLRLNWKRELERWLVRPLKVGIADASAGYPGWADIVVINYDIVHKYEGELRRDRWDLLVADEVHYMKNPQARRTKYVLGFWNKKEKREDPTPIPAKRRIFLTGTPIVNRPIELWPLVHSLDPKTFKSFWGYAKRYCDAFQNGYGWDFSGAAHLDELQEKLRSSIMIRRLKSEVLKDLPAKLRQILTLPANGAAGAVTKEAALYERLQKEKERLTALVELSKASDDPEDYERAAEALRDYARVMFEEMSKARHETARAKVPYVIEHIKNVIEGGSKVVVFTYHIDVLEAIVEAFAGTAVYLHGGVALTKRQEAVDRFQSDDDVKVFVGQIRAAGVGITLTAASHVVFAELDWTPGNVTQAEDRCHRIGQASSVLVQHLVLDGSLDARMVRTLVKKQDVIDRALDKEGKKGAGPDFAQLMAEAEKEKEKATTRRENRDRLGQLAEKLDDVQTEAIHYVLRILTGLDPDHAAGLNDVGYNKIDTYIGHDLAKMPKLSKRQAALGYVLVKKYHRQYDEDLFNLIYGETEQCHS